MNFGSPFSKKGNQNRKESLFQEDDVLSIDLNDGGPIYESANYTPGFNHINNQLNMVSLIPSRTYCKLLLG